MEKLNLCIALVVTIRTNQDYIFFNTWLDGNSLKGSYFLFF